MCLPTEAVALDVHGTTDEELWALIVLELSGEGTSSERKEATTHTGGAAPKEPGNRFVLNCRGLCGSFVFTFV